MRVLKRICSLLVAQWGLTSQITKNLLKIHQINAFLGLFFLTCNHLPWKRTGEALGNMPKRPSRLQRSPCTHPEAGCANLGKLLLLLPGCLMSPKVIRTNGRSALPENPVLQGIWAGREKGSAEKLKGNCYSLICKCSFIESGHYLVAKCAQFNYLQRKLLVEKLIQRNSFLSPSWKPINGACISTGMKKWLWMIKI